jgi:hypothetical protein
VSASFGGIDRANAMNEKKKPSTSNNIAFGMLVGFLMAAAYSLLALGIYAVTLGEAFEEEGLSLGAVLLSYWIGGIASGVVLGLLKPFTDSKRKAMIVGPIIAMPAVAMLGIAIDGLPWNWTSDSILTFIIMSLIFGSYGGYVFGGRQTTAGDRPELY